MRAYCFYTKALVSLKTKLEFVSDPGEKVISLMYLKMGEKAVVSDRGVARSFNY